MFGISYDATFKEMSQIAVQPHTECGRRQEQSKKVWVWTHPEKGSRDFSGGPVVKTLCFHGGGIQRNPRPKNGEGEGHSSLMLISWKTLGKSLYLSYPWGRWNTPVPSGAKLMNTVHEWAQAEARALRYLRLGDRSVTWNCRPSACGSNTFSREAKNFKKNLSFNF